MSREAIWGRQAVAEALRAGRRTIHQLYVADGVKDSEIDGILRAAEAAGSGVERASRETLGRHASGNVHQGVVGMFDPYPYVDLETILSRAARSGRAPLVVVAAHIEDPHNLGSILRTAECAGVHGVIIPKKRAVGVTPAVVRVSAGATEHMAVARVPNLVRTVEELKERRIWVYGADMDGASIFEAAFEGGLALCFGSEESGLPRLLRERCDGLVAIPLFGRIESLNVGVAAGVVIYEALRSRMSAAGGGR